MKKLLAFLLILTLLPLGAAVADTVKTAEDWKDTYPEVYASYMANQENDSVISHIEEYPMITTLYEGMAFSKFYNSARGHVYTLEDVAATGRPHPLANCLTCKTPDYTAVVNAQGVGAYSISFDEMYAQVTQPISCYNCHANAPGALTVTHGYLGDAMATETTVPNETLVCAQCHVEYYFAKDTKATTLPYDSLAATAPDAILAYYNEMGFSDCENPRTGVGQIKVQHPEFETFMGAGSVHATMFNCASCHMGTGTTDAGVTYVSHEWTSPLDNEALVKNNCAACHTDFSGMVKGIQEKAEARTNEVGGILVTLTEKLAGAVDTLDEATLSKVRSLNRDAQFYWDFVFVENSEGAHNSKLTHECLDKAETLANEALGLLA